MNLDKLKRIQITTVVLVNTSLTPLPSILIIIIPKDTKVRTTTIPCSVKSVQSYIEELIINRVNNKSRNFKYL